jgi:glycosyltransferase involved in cell wall biosynthesis
LQKRFKIGFLTTHPVQYQIPLFYHLSEHEAIDLTVFYCLIPNNIQQGVGFGIPFEWDIPLLNGYKYNVLNNVSKKPSVSHFFGCDTPDIIEKLKQNRFDAFIVNGWLVKSCVQLLLACHRRRIPCLVRGESNAMQVRPLWKRLIHRILLINYAAFLAIGKSNRDFYVYNGVNEEKIFDAPYCVDNKRFSYKSIKMKPNRNNLRKQWDIATDSIVFLFCAKFVPKKRPMDLLRAFNIAIEKSLPSKNIHLLMVGDGELKAECERYVASHKLPVIFTGFLNQTEIISAYVTSDCLFLVSDYGETWGLVVNEAMACGIPAIVSDRVGCHPDLIIRGKTGNIFPFGDIDSLADIILNYSQSPVNLKYMGSEARNHISQYSYDKVVKGTLEALNYVCNRIT